jgi:hypothetical protein
MALLHGAGSYSMVGVTCLGDEIVKDKDTEAN